MRRVLKQIGYLLVILFFLPYVVTIFVNGNGILKSKDLGVPYVTVKRGDTIEEMSLDEYGISVLAKEIQADAPVEAIKAQAVLVRTSIYKSIHEEGSDVVLTKEFWNKSQMEMNWGTRGYSANYAIMQDCWQETANTILVYEGNPALTPYHKISNGKTRSGQEVLGVQDYPYLQIKDCPKDLASADAITTSIIPETGLQVLEWDSAGYVTKVKCGEEEVLGEEFRSTYHLTSASFTLQDFDGKTRVIAQGIGHGLGLSQHTAIEMAKEGIGYREILEYFFEATKLQEVAEILIKTE